MMTDRQMIADALTRLADFADAARSVAPLVGAAAVGVWAASLAAWILVKTAAIVAIKRSAQPASSRRRSSNGPEVG